MFNTYIKDQIYHSQYTLSALTMEERHQKKSKNRPTILTNIMHQADYGNLLTF